MKTFPFLFILAFFFPFPPHYLISSFIYKAQFKTVNPPLVSSPFALDLLYLLQVFKGI